MAGFERRRLALLQSIAQGPDGQASYGFGTGYFVTANLVLTASHVVAEEGVRKLEVRTEADAAWRAAEPVPVWRNQILDAALIRVDEGLNDAPDVAWGEERFGENQIWTSSGYPRAGVADSGGVSARKTVGLTGSLLAEGGGGQGALELDLSVDAPPDPDDWPGISGAPVFVGERLVGLVKEVPKSFQGKRLLGVPSYALLENHAFRVAISPPWLDNLPCEPWVLVVVSEGKHEDLSERVKGALEKHGETLRAVVGQNLVLQPISVKITEALVTPGRWLQFVRALCAAPIALFDASGAEPEPAVMIALGIRSVVRRGITITSTEKRLTEEHLAQLPFNIQETKLIHHGKGFDPADERHPLNRIASAIKEGWLELGSQPRYLDLPAYDAVRGPVPTAQGVSARERILVLCPFRKDYAENWLHLANTIALKYPALPVARMLDIASPRLVGQALYESIRWAKTCIVDFTHWRANVFFELGVRLACSEVGPVCVLERTAADRTAEKGGLNQRERLVALFRPTTYGLSDDDDTVRVALDQHDLVVRKLQTPTPLTALPHDATYRACVAHFEWAQERITVDPHEALRRSVEETFGKDRQADGQPPVLFSPNPSFRKELERSVRERWIAAWYYLRHRYSEKEWEDNAALRATLVKFGNDVLQFGIGKANEPHLNALRDQIYEVLDVVEAIDSRTGRGQ